MYPCCSKPLKKPRRCGGSASIVSAAPSPHSPPIATPKSARRTRKIVKFGEKAVSSSIVA